MRLAWKPIAIGVVSAVLAFLGLIQIAHWRQDEAMVHGLGQLVIYNLQRGKLDPVPEQPVAPAKVGAPPSAPAPAPEPPKK